MWKFVTLYGRICLFLCSGAFGVVHRCQEKATGKTFVAKFVNTPQHNDKNVIRNEVSHCLWPRDDANRCDHMTRSVCVTTWRNQSVWPRDVLLQFLSYTQADFLSILRNVYQVNYELSNMKSRQQCGQGRAHLIQTSESCVTSIVFLPALTIDCVWLITSQMIIVMQCIAKRFPSSALWSLRRSRESNFEVLLLDFFSIAYAWSIVRKLLSDYWVKVMQHRLFIPNCMRRI